MSKCYSFGQPMSQQITISPQEKRRLEKFVNIAQRIAASRFLQETTNIKLSTRIEMGKPVEQTIGGFDEDLLRSALWDIRKLMLDKDGIEYTKICNIIIKHAPNEEVRQRAQEYRDVYMKFMDGTPSLKIVTGTVVHTHRKILNDWLHGHYAHELNKQADNLEALGFLQDPHKLLFVGAASTLARLAYGLSKQAESILTA